jgi:hypothetical protein
MNEKPFLKGSVSYNLQVRKVFFRCFHRFIKVNRTSESIFDYCEVTDTVESKYSFTLPAAAVAESLTPESQLTISHLLPTAKRQM